MTEGQPPEHQSIIEKISKFLEKMKLKESGADRKRRLTRGIPREEVPEALLKASADSVSPPVVIRKSRSTQAELPQKLQGVSLERNIRAAETFIASIRDPRRFRQDPSYPQFLIDDRFLLVEAPVEMGWFNAQQLVNIAEGRYHLPMAMYIVEDHARLVIGVQNEGFRGFNVYLYNPTANGFSNIRLPHGSVLNISSGIYMNSLARHEITTGKYDISFLDDPSFKEYRESLINGKMAALQRNARDCIPYCLLVNAMLDGLRSGNTGFKDAGIPQFDKDFSVRILKREEILPPEQPRPRVKVI